MKAFTEGRHILPQERSYHPIHTDKPVFIITEPKFTDVGSANLNCPHCNGKLKRFPQRRTKCPYCDRVIYSRSRPLDRKKVLLNDEESERVEQEWAEFNKHQHLIRIISEIIPDDSETVISQVYGDLHSTMEKEPSIIDILKRINDQKSEQSLSTGMFNQFRYHLLFESDILKFEGRDLESLKRLLQVIYLDMNGISNAGNAKNKPVFNLKTASKSLDLLGEIRTVRIRLGFDLEQVKKEFITSAEDVTRILKPRSPPLKAEELWDQISRIVE